MKWITATGLLTLTGVATFGGRAMLSTDNITPRRTVAKVRGEMSIPGYDQLQALRELDRTLLHESVRQDEELATEVLGLQADIYRELGAYADAREALEQIVAVYEPESLDLKLEIANLQSLEGQTQAARGRVTRILDDAPTFGPAWRLRGRLEVVEGKQTIDEAADIARQFLIADDANRAIEILNELGAREAGDPARIPAAHALREIFLPRNKQPLQQVLNLADKASSVLSGARASYAHAFTHEVDATGAREYVELLMDAGRGGLAGDFGEAALALPVVYSDPFFRRSLILVHERQGHGDRAANLAADWEYRRDGAPIPLAQTAMRILADRNRWGRMGQAAHFLRTIGSPTIQGPAYFYLGKMAYHQAINGTGLTDQDRFERYGRAQVQLSEYLKSDAPEPYPGANAEAWFSMARARGAQSDTERELELLIQAILEFPWTDGEAYLRVVELQREHANSGYRIPEERWTIGMAMLPERTAELYDTWVELGEASLLSEQQDFDKLYTRVRMRDAAFPSADVGPYTLYRIAERHYENGAYLSAIRVTRELLLNYPDLLPVIDTLTKSLIARGQSRQAIEHIIERLALVGADETTRGYIAQLEPEDFTEDQILRAIRADPIGLGRSYVARFLLDNGAPERAWRALSMADAPADDIDQQLLRGDALIQLGRFEEASAQLSGIELGRLDGRLIETLIEARLGAGENDEVQALVGRLVATSDPDREVLLAVTDQLLLGSRYEDAGRLLERLDGDVQSRGSDVLVRMALQCALTGDRSGALDALERAEPFYADGSLELVRIFFAVEDHDWTRLPALVTELRATDFTPTPLQDAILALFEERLEAGNQMAETGRRENPYSPEWMIVHSGARLLVDADIVPSAYFGKLAKQDTRALLRGGTGVNRDPREALMLLLAIDHGGWSIWATPRVFRLFQEKGGMIWPAYLSTRLYRVLGKNDAALNGLERLAERQPDFGPAWDTLLEVLYEEYPENPYHGRILATRVKRLRSLGRVFQDEPLQIAIDAASELVLDGDYARAADRIQRALDQAEGSTNAGRALLGRLYSLEGNYKRAVVEYDRACEDLEPASDSPLVKEFLDILQRAGRTNAKPGQRLSPERINAYLDRLEGRFPHDPLIPLERTRVEVASDPRNPDLFVTRAEFNLSKLRERTDDAALNALRPGAADTWIAYLLEFAPGLAEELIREDLRHSPGDVDLWLLLARTTEVRGDRESALQLYEAIVATSDDATAHLAYARLLADSGASLSDVKKHLDAVSAASGERVPVTAHYTRAKAILHDRNPNLREAISILERLWTARKESASAIDTFELGRTYTAALIARRRAEDLTRLEELFDEIRPHAIVDPYADDFLRAMEAVVAQAAPLDKSQ
ncbi:MAG: hypothetical protein GY711_32845 [bacterium]|nr:hypothetical protein [bacterium]